MNKIVNVVKMGINGEGIAYINKKPVFVSGCFPEEVVECEAYSSSDKFLKARTKRILKESKYRLKGEIVSKKDVSCPLIDMDYKRQLFYKKEILKESISKYSKLDVSIIKDVVSNIDIFNYRNQCKLPVKEINGKLYTGLYENDSNKFIKIDDFIVHNNTIELVRKKLLNILNKYKVSSYSNKSKKGIRNIVIRSIYDKTQIILVGGNDIYDSKIIDEIFSINTVVSLWQNINCKKNSIEIFGNKDVFLKGSKTLDFNFMDKYITLLHKSFFQLNTNQTENLYNLVIDLIKPCDFIVEAYCGVGIMSLLASNKANKVLGIESVKEAVDNARNNAKNNGLNDKCSFICEDSFKKLNTINENIDYLIVDPPRSGLDDNMIDCILNKNISNIIYVSCNVSTLSKNLAILKKNYKVKTIIPVDMFSHSAHVESVVLLERR